MLKPCTVTTSQNISERLILEFGHVLHSALDAAPLDLLLRLARVRGLAVALLVDTPHVDVEDDDGSKLHGVTDQHAVQNVSEFVPQVLKCGVDLRDVR
jgi:hypothetical protein